MKKTLIALFLLCVTALAYAAPQKHTFEVGNKTFLLDGTPFVVKAAELHYPRIPREYWEHRIQMCKALGMNTICIYIFWNAHEPQEGAFDFSGNNDVAEFVRLAQKNGMYVIVRPGPYVCAEWDMGGLPWWLLKKDDIKLRSLDPQFMEPVKRFEAKVAEQLVPLTVENGGPIIMLQVENEFGAYATDKLYVAALRDYMRSLGWDKTVMFQCDWSSNFDLNGLDDTQWTMNFGSSTDVLGEFVRLEQMRPNSPKMCSEFWSGWFDAWGYAHETRPTKDLVGGIATMLDNGISFSLYMTHGGTSFAQWAGANLPGYKPDCTSYDYDAPINEQGSATPKYHALRALLQKYSDTKLPPIPKGKPIITIPEFTFTEMAPLFSNLPPSQRSEHIVNMEALNQGWGSMIYACSLPKTDESSILRITGLHDFAIIYVDGKYIGKLYRGDKEEAIMLPATPEGARLEILVEAMGRINYLEINDKKGITEKVELITKSKGHDLTYSLNNWDITLLPLGYENVTSVNYKPLAFNADAAQRDKAGYYKASFKVSKPGDTFLDMSSWGKGLVWVNGHCLGRFWKVGPQQTLYLPGCWLKKGTNEIVVMDILGPSAAKTAGFATPILDVLNKDASSDAVPVPASARPTAPQPSPAGNDAAPGA
ncbi:MAG: beta-galactosidase [Muribaculaceae bacterium]|nr:beta-galactosidase [Muribaculaceae bacterium]